MLERSIRMFLNWFGVDIVKIYKPPGDKKAEGFRFEPVRNTMEEALKHLLRLNFHPPVVVDVGAAKGTPPLLKVYPESRYLWIEPLVEFEGELKNLATRYHGDTLLAVAGKDSGTVKLNVHSDLMGSSTYQESDGIEADGTGREVNMVRLDDLIGPYGLKQDVLLKVDVQGGELDVLAGAPQLLRRCEVVILEVSFFKLFRSNPEFSDVISYMKEKGFVVYDLVEGLNRPLDNALAQKDVFFVKEDGLFRKSHHWATMEQRRALAQ